MIINEVRKRQVLSFSSSKQMIQENTCTNTINILVSSLFGYGIILKSFKKSIFIRKNIRKQIFSIELRLDSMCLPREQDGKRIQKLSFSQSIIQCENRIYMPLLPHCLRVWYPLVFIEIDCIRRHPCLSELTPYQI